MSNNEKNINEKINAELRAARGVTVSGKEPSEDDVKFAKWFRRQVKRNTYETDLSGKITARDGEPVNDG